MEGESILLLIFIFIILVAVIVIAILYFTYVNKYNESNIFYKNLLEIIKKDTTVDSELIKSDFKITNLDEENRKLSNILDYPNTASEEIEDEVAKQIEAAFDNDNSELSVGFNSKFNAKLNSALSTAPTDLEDDEEKKWNNIIGFDYDKANIYKDIIDADDSGFLTEIYDAELTTEQKNAKYIEYHNTINHAHILLGSDSTTGTFEAPTHSISTKHIDLLKNAEEGYSTQNDTDILTTASNGSSLQGADLNKAYLKKAFKYIANNDLKQKIDNKADSDNTLDLVDLSMAPYSTVPTGKKGIDMTKVVFCNGTNCYNVNITPGIAAQPASGGSPEVPETPPAFSLSEV